MADPLAVKVKVKEEERKRERERGVRSMVLKVSLAAWLMILVLSHSQH
jgi:hypothetical protein